MGHARRNDPYTIGEHLRLAMEDLGTTAIKIGQILSTRPDIIPPEISSELDKLRERVSPIPTRQIREVIEREVGTSIEDLFDEFDEAP